MSSLSVGMSPVKGSNFEIPMKLLLRKLIGIRYKQWIVDEHGAAIELNSHSAGMGWK